MSAMSRNKNCQRSQERQQLPMATWQQRKHQRPTTPMVRQGHRPIGVSGRLPRLRRHPAQQPTPSNSELENPCRETRRTTMQSTHCCIHRMKPPPAPQPSRQSRRGRRGPTRRAARSARSCGDRHGPCQSPRPRPSLPAPTRFDTLHSYDERHTGCGAKRSVRMAIYGKLIFDALGSA